MSKTGQKLSVVLELRRDPGAAGDAERKGPLGASGVWKRLARCTGYTCVHAVKFHPSAHNLCSLEYGFYISVKS